MQYKIYIEKYTSGIHSLMSIYEATQVTTIQVKKLNTADTQKFQCFYFPLQPHCIYLFFFRNSRYLPF